MSKISFQNCNLILSKTKNYLANFHPFLIRQIIFSKRILLMVWHLKLKAEAKLNNFATNFMHFSFSCKFYPVAEYNSNFFKFMLQDSALSHKL